MLSSVDEAILLLKKWKSNSSKLRMVLGTDHARMALHGRVSEIVNSSVCCKGDEAGDEVHFDLAGASSISFVDDRGLPKGLEVLKPFVTGDLITAVFKDGTRLALLNETSPS